ncbi:MAG TPA: DUF4870 domain-containing protein [Spirochaetia bacterium]|nr:DUF4870 domain-containing protein [Spirochaetia bacterium]
MDAHVIQIPQPHEISQREKEDAMGAYFMMFAAWGLGFPLPVLNLIAAFIYYFIHRKKSRFVAFHALQSLLSQLPVTIINVGLLAWLLKILFTNLYFPPEFFIYLIFMVLVNILYLVFSIVALIRARKGRFYYFPLFGRISFGRYYGPNAVSFEESEEPNRPPEGL